MKILSLNVNISKKKKSKLYKTVISKECLKKIIFIYFFKFLLKHENMYV